MVRQVMQAPPNRRSSQSLGRSSLFHFNATKDRSLFDHFALVRRQRALRKLPSRVRNDSSETSDWSCIDCMSTTGVPPILPSSYPRLWILSHESEFRLGGHETIPWIYKITFQDLRMLIVRNTFHLLRIPVGQGMLKGPRRPHLYI